MFLHGSLLHLGGNLLYLWIFGNNVEDRLGHVGYLAFYVVGGVVATLAHVAVNADSTIPLVGASGAIAAVMGAYLVWHPNARINTLVMMIFITFVRVKAKWLLAFWFVLQFFTGNDSGVAWMAHVGGFVFGVVGGLLLGPGSKRRRQPEPAYPWASWAATAAGSSATRSGVGCTGRSTAVVTPDSTRAKRQPQATARAPSVSARSPTTTPSVPHRSTSSLAIGAY